MWDSAIGPSELIGNKLCRGSTLLRGLTRSPTIFSNSWTEKDMTPGRDQWGSGEARRPGIPIAAGHVGYMAVVRDPATHRLRAAPPDSLPIAEWTSRGIFHKSILANDMFEGKQAWDWLLNSTEADGFTPEEVAVAGEWKALPDYKWRSRRTDNDSLGHTTVHR